MSTAFRHIRRVTYADCTVGNHVYYARYLDFLEAARGELFRALGTTFQAWQDQGLIFPVIECRLQYRGPARYDDEITIEVTVLQAEGVRLGFGYRLVKADGTLLVEAETRHVCTSLAERPKRLPEPLRTGLEPFRAPPEDVGPDRPSQKLQT
jgi:acyl-CoA thioester hydrolase